MQKNVAGQKWYVFAFGGNNHSNPGDPITGDAANITATLSQDGGADASLGAGANPVELGGGRYVFTPTQAESNADVLSLNPVSATPNVLVIGVPGTIYTTPPNFSVLGVAADGDLNQVKQVEGDTKQSGDAFPAVSSNLDVPVSSRSSHSEDDVWTGPATRTITGTVQLSPVTHAGAVIPTVSALTGHTPQSEDNATRLADLQARTPVALSGGRMAADTQALGNDTNALDNLAAGANELYPFTVGASPNATSIPTSITGTPFSNPNHFEKRVVTINGETRKITASTGSPVVLTTEAFNSVPSQNDIGVIS